MSAYLFLLYTPLPYAFSTAASYHENVAEVTGSVVENGVDVNGYDGMTPLYEAVLNRNEEKARILIENGAFVNVVFLGRSILHVAVSRNLRWTVRLLLAVDALVDLPDFPNADTPLHYAVRANDAEIADMLLWKGAKHVANGWGRTPLNLAVFLGYEDVANVLVTAGADIDAYYVPPRNIRAVNPEGRPSLTSRLEAAPEPPEKFKIWSLIMQQFYPAAYKYGRRKITFASFDKYVMKMTKAHVENLSPLSTIITSTSRLPASSDMATAHSDLKDIWRQYENSRAFVLYRLLKCADPKIKSTHRSELEIVHRQVFRDMLKELIGGTYLNVLPLELVEDVFSYSGYYGWILSAMSWSIALASYTKRVVEMSHECKIKGFIHKLEVH